VVERDMSTIHLDSSCPSGDGYSCYVFISKHPIAGNRTLEKIILLNALVPNPTEPTIIISTPVTVEEAKELVNKAEKVESYIGHEATAKLLTQIFEREIPVNRAMYIPERYDLAIVVRLKKRLEKPEDVKNVTENDIELLLVRYYTDVHVVIYK
jgi:hypothetical protein